MFCFTSQLLVIFSRKREFKKFTFVLRGVYIIFSGLMFNIYESLPVACYPFRSASIGQNVINLTDFSPSFHRVYEVRN